MIEREIQKNEEINKDKSEKEKKNNNNNIAFSQIFSHSNNMIEFNIDKNEIHNFIGKLCKKYELDNDMINSITTNINKKLEEKESLLLGQNQEKIEDNKEIKENKVDDNIQNKEYIKHEENNIEDNLQNKDDNQIKYNNGERNENK